MEGVWGSLAQSSTQRAWDCYHCHQGPREGVFSWCQRQQVGRAILSNAVSPGDRDVPSCGKLTQGRAHGWAATQQSRSKALGQVAFGIGDARATKDS